MIELKDIMEEVGRTLIGLYPHIKGMTSERIEDMESISPGFSIELITSRNRAVSENISNKFVDIDIIYFSENNTVLEALEVQEALTRAFSLGLKVKDRFLHTLGEAESKLVDQDLHFLVRYHFADELKPLYVDEDGNLKDIDTGNTNLGNIDEDREIEYMERLESRWTLRKD